MLNGKTIAVVVPAYNEANQIQGVITTLPDFVDWTIVVDDKSADHTREVVEHCAEDRPQVIPVAHEVNQGVGAAIRTGYKKALEIGADVIAVVAGDGQMDPTELESIVRPAVEREADYVKGNRFMSGESWKVIPRSRYLGNAVLSLLTKVVSGYWHIADSQSGYTAVTAEALRLIEIDAVYGRYGYCNDLLVRLNAVGLVVQDVPVRSIYGVGEHSKMMLWKVIPTISWLLFRMFLWRMKEKYIIRDFHPLVFFYLMFFLLSPVGLFLGGLFAYKFIVKAYVSVPAVVLSVFCLISAAQFLLFAMWFDMDYNKEFSKVRRR